MLALLLGAALALTDPYAPPPAPGTPERLAHDAMFGKPGADAAIEQWLKANPGAPVAQRRALLHRLCTDYGPRGIRKLRARACAAERRLDPDGNSEDAQLAVVLRDAPPTRAMGHAEVPLTDNPLGSKSVEVSANGVTSSWIFDTGAEDSVVIQSVAEKMGARFLPGVVEVGTTTAPVHARVAILDRLTIGSSTIENLPLLVLPDAQLKILGDYTIPGILGLPAMAAYHRIAWIGRGTRLALGGINLPAMPSVPVYWHEEGLGIPIQTRLGTLGAHFDSGANVSYLRAPGRALLSQAEQAAAVDKTVRMGGAGGVVESHQKQLPSFGFSIAGTAITLSNVNIEDDNQESAARIGSDILSRMKFFAIDFDRMLLSVEPILVE